MIRSDFADESRWRRYVDAMDRAVSHALSFKSPSDRTDLARAKFTMLYAGLPNWDQGGLSTPALREQFAELHSGTDWTSGLREDVFLYVDASALGSLDTERPF
jgi:hypothetical protein